MAGVLLDGQLTWPMEVDEEGYRVYKVKYYVLAGFLDGPFIVSQTPGLHLPGAIWLVDNDVDQWAKRTFETKYKPVVEKEKNRLWEVEETFTNRPQKRCLPSQINPTGDPLLEPQKLSGGFTKFTEEATKDRFFNFIKNSSHEQIRGPAVEFDANREFVRIEQNVPLLQLDLLASMIDTLNDRQLWGFTRRTIKLSAISWEQLCPAPGQTYYRRVFEFELLPFPRSWDRDIADEGTKALHGHWGNGGNEGYNWVVDRIGDPATGTVPNKNNPAHFIRVTDRNGNPMRVALDGNGKPVSLASGTGSGQTQQGNIHVEKYGESNFLLLGIPALLPQ